MLRAPLKSFRARTDSTLRPIERGVAVETSMPCSVELICATFRASECADRPVSEIPFRLSRPLRIDYFDVVDPQGIRGANAQLATCRFRRSHPSQPRLASQRLVLSSGAFVTGFLAPVCMPCESIAADSVNRAVARPRPAAELGALVVGDGLLNLGA
jgi:hypothetical protein